MRYNEEDIKALFSEEYKELTDDEIKKELIGQKFKLSSDNSIHNTVKVNDFTVGATGGAFLDFSVNDSWDDESEPMSKVEGKVIKDVKYKEYEVEFEFEDGSKASIGDSSGGEGIEMWKD